MPKSSNRDATVVQHLDNSCPGDMQQCCKSLTKVVLNVVQQFTKSHSTFIQKWSKRFAIIIQQLCQRCLALRQKSLTSYATVMQESSNSRPKVAQKSLGYFSSPSPVTDNTRERVSLGGSRGESQRGGYSEGL